MQTAVETPAYLSSAKAAGMSDAERIAAVDAVALDPTLGDLIVGAGGCRKFRLAGRGKGKSGGYRVISCFVDEETPVFLLAVFSKGDRADLSGEERLDLARLARTLREAKG